MPPRRHGWLFAALPAPLAGCATNPRIAPVARWIDPSQVVKLAAMRGVAGAFTLTVQGAPCPGPRYPDSERDHRDQRDLAVVAMPAAAHARAGRLHVKPERGLRGRRILAAGRARLEHIDFVANGQPSGRNSRPDPRAGHQYRADSAPVTVTLRFR